MPTDTKTAKLTIRLTAATMQALESTSHRKGLLAAEYARDALETALAADKPKAASMALNISADSGRALAALVARLPEGTDPIQWLMSNQSQR